MDTRLEEVGFAEFTSMLITQTLDAVITSNLQQEESIAQLTTIAGLPLEEFRKLYLSANEIDAELLRLFPDVEKSGSSLVAEKKPYRFAEETISEQPAVFTLTGYEIQKDDVRKTDDSVVFTAIGVSNIRTAIGNRLAIIRQSSYKAITSRGIPRILVDHGKISAKITMRIDDMQSTPTGLSFNKLLIRPVNTRGAEYLTMKADITSEVEITFKTVLI